MIPLQKEINLKSWSTPGVIPGTIPRQFPISTNVFLHVYNEIAVPVDKIVVNFESRHYTVVSINKMASIGAFLNLKNKT